MNAIWTTVFLQPIINLLLALYHFFQTIGLPGVLGWAIIGLTIVVRLILYPLTVSQLKNTKRMQELSPKLKELKTKYGHDNRRHQEEQLRLYREQGINPMGGCLPALLQIPVFIALYNVLGQLFGAGPEKGVEYLNSLAYQFLPKLTQLDPTFFGVSLGVKPAQWQEIGVWLFLIPVATGATQLVLSKMMVPAKATSGVAKAGTTSIKAKGSEKESTEETMQAVQTQMMYLFPVMIGYFAYQFPLGLALYWNALTVFGIIQQYLVAGPGGLMDWLPKRAKI